MAKPNDDSGSGSWPGFLSELIKNFLILRDVFGYALPGGIFFGIGLLNHRFSVDSIKAFWGSSYQPPTWLAVIMAIGACYAMGHVMAGLAYLPSNVWGSPCPHRCKSPESLDKLESDPKRTKELNQQAALNDIRANYPELMTELERQSTMAQLRGTTGVAMLIGAVIFHGDHWWPAVGIGLAGIFLLIVFLFSAIPHIEDLKEATIRAGKLQPPEKPETPDDGQDKSANPLCAVKPVLYIKL